MSANYDLFLSIDRNLQELMDIAVSVADLSISLGAVRDRYRHWHGSVSFRTKTYLLIETRTSKDAEPDGFVEAFQITAHSEVGLYLDRDEPMEPQTRMMDDVAILLPMRLGCDAFFTQDLGTLMVYKNSVWTINTTVDFWPDRLRRSFVRNNIPYAEHAFDPSFSF